jgi:peptidoglycan-associated lipoprotein
MMILQKKTFTLLIVLVMILLCSCAKKKIEQVYGPHDQNQGQNSASRNIAPSPEMAPQPIEIPVSPSSSGQDINAVTDSLKKFEDEDIYFNFDEFTVSQDGKKILASKAAFLKTHPKLKVTVEGHCDERGTTEYNLALGEKRAGEVKKYLMFLGIDGNRLSVISYGKEKPAASGHNEEAWAKNRRAHFDAFEK